MDVSQCLSEKSHAASQRHLIKSRFANLLDVSDETY